MSTQTIKDRPLVTGLNGGRSIGWLKTAGAALLAQKKKLLLGGGALAIVAMAGFYFFGRDSSATQYMTVRVER